MIQSAGRRGDCAGAGSSRASAMCRQPTCAHTCSRCSADTKSSPQEDCRLVARCSAAARPSEITYGGGKCLRHAARSSRHALGEACCIFRWALANQRGIKGPGMLARKDLDADVPLLRTWRVLPPDTFGCRPMKASSACSSAVGSPPAFWITRRAMPPACMDVDRSMEARGPNGRLSSETAHVTLQCQ